MPFVRIDLSKKYPDGFAQQVGDIIYGAMRQHFNVPEDDKFQIITTEGQEYAFSVPKRGKWLQLIDQALFTQINAN